MANKLAEQMLFEIEERVMDAHEECPCPTTVALKHHNADCRALRLLMVEYQRMLGKRDG